MKYTYKKIGKEVNDWKDREEDTSNVQKTSLEENN